MARSINKAIIVGNLTRDPEMRYTPNGQAVTSFGVATNRRWTTNNEQREETEFHNVVAWAKLAEICNQLLKKGRKVYIEGRLRTHSWEGKDGVTRRRTEIVARDMVVLDRRPEVAAEVGEEYVVPEKILEEPSVGASLEEEPMEKAKTKSEKTGKEEKKLSPAKGGTKSAPGGKIEDVDPEEIPF